MGLFNRPKAPAPPPATKPEEKPAEAALTKADVQTMIEGASAATANQLTSVIGELRSGIEALATRQPVVVAAPQQQIVEAPITDNDIDEALNSGQGARAVRALIDRQARDVTVGLERRINELTEFGVNAIANLTAETLKTLPHYGRFKKEIDMKLGALTPAMRANPDTLKLIYNSVVGEHAETLANEARESALRKGDEGGTPGNEIDVRGGGGVGRPGSGGARVEGGNKVPSVEEFAGAGALVSLKEKDPRSGRDADTFAQSMGYKDWAHYVGQYESLRAEQGDTL